MSRKVFDAAAAFQKQDWSTVHRLAGELAAENPTGAAGFTVIQSEDIAQPLPDIRWLVQALDICPGAPTLIAGYGFAGKTLAVQSLALSLAAGKKIWGTFVGAAEVGRVVHLDWEQGPRLTRARYQRLARGLGIELQELGDRLGLVSLADKYIDTPAGEAALLKVAEGRALAIVDSLRAACPSLDENASEIRAPLDVLGQISERTGCCFVVLHHARKPNKDNGGGAKYAIRGSGALFDACQSVLVFSREDKNQPILVQHVKARVSGVPTDDFGLEVTDVPNGVTVKASGIVQETAEEREQKLLGPIKERILAYLRKEGGVRSGNEVEKHIVGNRPLIMRAWKELISEGGIEDTKSGQHRYCASNSSTVMGPS